MQAVEWVAVDQSKSSDFQLTNVRQQSGSYRVRVKDAARPDACSGSDQGQERRRSRVR